MTREKPLIHLFSTPYGYYIFDANKNSVLKTGKAFYEYLYKEQRDILDHRNDFTEEIRIADKLKEKGFLSSKRVLKVVHSAEPLLESHLNNKLQKITLQVTQQCNFRCSYCIYSGATQELQRNHSNKKMELATALKGIDFLFEHASDSSEVNIGFYGGEPLLYFGFVKKCIDYAAENSGGKKCTYSITTNATLINEEVMDFLERNRVSLTISLDGPKEIHNKNRRFAANGEGTFDAVYKNILKILNKYPGYFARNVNINAVIDAEEDFHAVAGFFLKDEALKNTMLTSNLISDSYAFEKTNIPEDYMIKRNYELFKVYLSILDKIDKKHASGIVMSDYGSLKAKAAQLEPKECLPDTACHGGPCIPGKSRLFIGTEGDFYPCERVSEASEVMKIGNVHKGYDFNKIRNLMSIGRLTEEDCQKCWAFTHCTLCAAQADNGDSLSAEVKKQYCDGVRANMDNLLKDYTVLKELGHDFNADSGQI